MKKSEESQKKVSREWVEVKRELKEGKQKASRESQKRVSRESEEKKIGLNQGKLRQFL